MQKSCVKCGSQFEVTDDDLKFYEKVSPTFNDIKIQIPAPNQCPDCRLQRRMAHRNEWSLYSRKCDLSDKQIVSIYSPDVPFEVYEQSEWWSDKYDPLEYGREFDFSKTFFEQFNELNMSVPKASIINAKSENSAYTNYSAENNNLYMVVGGLGCERCYHSYRIFYSSDICDCYDMYKCERCYMCNECSELFDCTGCLRCQNGSDLKYCLDCNGCNHCFGCINMRNKKYCIMNKEYSEAEYESKVVELMKDPKKTLADISKFQSKFPRRSSYIIQCTNSTGDRLMQCKNCSNCYTVTDMEDCKYTQIAVGSKDCVDCNFSDNCELMFFSANNEKNYHILYGCMNWYNKYTIYCTNCFYSTNLFGCSGMKKHNYCILNKQYSKEEYEELIPKIIDHMKTTNEWGEYFPFELSPFAYNETVAHEYYPLTKEEVEKRGFKWKEMKDEIPKVEKIISASQLPDTIEDIPDDVLNWAIKCEETDRPFKIVK